jgi:hypothetical protein
MKIHEVCVSQYIDNKWVPLMVIYSGESEDEANEVMDDQLEFIDSFRKFGFFPLEKEDETIYVNFINGPLRVYKYLRRGGGRKWGTNGYVLNMLKS